MVKDGDLSFCMWSTMNAAGVWKLQSINGIMNSHMYWSVINYKMLL